MKEIETCVSKIFYESGFTIKSEPIALNTFKNEPDLLAQKGTEKYYVEIKSMRHIPDAVFKQVCIDAGCCQMKPVLVSMYPITKEKREYYEETFPALILIDISNLLYAVEYNESLKNTLISLLSYTVDRIVPQKGFLCSETLQHNNQLESLLVELENCQTGRPMARNFEIICTDLLKEIFCDDLTLWREQPHSNKDLYRFDLLCRTKDNIQKTFWSIVEKYYNSKYVVFEFKNYTEPVTQKEIYTTEKYLYEKALRKVAIMISANGYDENAQWAAKGCLRENSKLILLLSSSDLCEMAKVKQNQDDPSGYLLNLLDGLLLELEK